MKLLVKLIVLVVVLGGAFVAWQFWSDLDAGEKHHLVDKAQSGDAEGLADAVKFKAGEAIDRQKQNAAELARDGATKVVDAANEQLKEAANKAIDKAAADAKAKIAGDAGVPVVDGGPKK